MSGGKRTLGGGKGMAEWEGGDEREREREREGGSEEERNQSKERESGWT